MAGGERRLATKGLPVETLKPGWLIELLSVITDPNIAVILMLVGIYGLFFEFSSPGAVAPGVIGTICLLLGLYALNTLPIDYAGLALMLLGIGFLVVEAFNPTVVLGLGGLAAFLLGAAMLFKVEAPGYQLSWTVIGIAAAMIFGLTVLTGSYLWRSPQNPGAGRRTSHARPAGRNPGLVGRGRPCDCPRRTLAGAGRGGLCARRDGRGHGRRGPDSRRAAPAEQETENSHDDRLSSPISCSRSSSSCFSPRPFAS